MPYNLHTLPTWNINIVCNNFTWTTGDNTGGFYEDIFHLDSKDVQFLRFFLMVKGMAGHTGVKGQSVYGPLTELFYGHIRKGSSIYSFGSESSGRLPLSWVSLTQESNRTASENELAHAQQDLQTLEESQ
jgi:hypothetical protein